MKASTDSRVMAIRADALVGANTCSVVDEAMSDEELMQSLTESGIGSPADAVAWARDLEGLQMDRMMDHRWGEDDDPEFAIKAEWDQRVLALA